MFKGSANMGITPHGIIINNAYTSMQEHREHSQRNTRIKYSNCFMPSEDVPPREVGRNDAGISLQDAMEHFLSKTRDEDLVKKRTLNKSKK